ncbi:hypothetical protein ACF0H5_017522 [Mactra antiquata]
MDISDNVTNGQTNINFSLPEFSDSNQTSIVPIFINTTTEFTISTNSTVSTDSGDSLIPSTSFNWAFIPAFAVLIILIIACIRCCKWFRKYTRGDKTDKAFYIVDEIEDDVFVNNEMSPDSAYDSYCSVSRRHNSGGENSLHAVKGIIFREQPVASTSGTTNGSKKSPDIDKRNADTVIPLMEKDNNSTDNDNRKPSSSSSQTTVTTCCEMVHCKLCRKTCKNRACQVQIEIERTDLPGIDTGLTTFTSDRPPKIMTRNSDVKRACADCACRTKRKRNFPSKSIGTQTNKSFTHRLSRKRRVSDNPSTNSENAEGSRSSNQDIQELDSRNENSDVETDKNLNNNSEVQICNGDVVKFCNGDVNAVRGKNVSVINVTRVNTPVNNPQQNGQMQNEIIAES